MLLIHFFTGEKVLPPYLFSTILYSSSSKALLNCCPRMASSNFYFPVSALILYLPIASLFSPAPHPRNFPFRQSQHFPVFLSLEPAPHLCLTNDLYNLFFFFNSFPFYFIIHWWCHAFQLCPKFRDHKDTGRSLDVWVTMMCYSSSFIPSLQWESDRNRRKSKFLSYDPKWIGPLHFLMIFLNEFTCTSLCFGFCWF